MEKTNRPPESGRHVWRPGDTLLGIAMQNRTTMTAIRSANPDVDFEDVRPDTPISIPPAAPQCPSGDTYAVREGDTISSIARRLGVTTGELMDRNPYVDPEALVVGQVLCTPESRHEPEPEPIPAAAAAPEPSGPAPVPVTCPAGYTSDTVRFGQALADILMRYDISYQAFRRANPSISAARLIPGQRYCIPPVGQRGLCGTGLNYLIMEGEGLDDIAGRLGITAERLLLLNQNMAPGDFVPGRVICVPGN